MKHDQWASTPVRWATTAAGIGIVVTLVAAPRATGYAAAAGVALVVLVLGVEWFMREQRPAGQTDPAADQPACAGCAGCGGPDCIARPDPATAAGRACRCAGVGFGGKGDCPVHDELTAEEARELVDDLSLQLYRAGDALDFVAEMCDIADEHRGVRGKPATVTTTRVREWLKGAQCARQAGLVLHPDASGQIRMPVRTDPDTTGQDDADQGGHDPDSIRTRLAAALHEDPHADWHYLTGRAAEIREGRDRADAECNRLRRMVDEYSAGARGLSDKLRAARAECDAIEAVETEASEPPTRDDMRLVISRFRRTITEEA